MSDTASPPGSLLGGGLDPVPLQVTDDRDPWMPPDLTPRSHCVAGQVAARRGHETRRQQLISAISSTDLSQFGSFGRTSGPFGDALSSPSRSSRVPGTSVYYGGEHPWTRHLKRASTGIWRLRTSIA